MANSKQKPGTSSEVNWPTRALAKAHGSVWILGLTSALLVWLAFPPVGFWPLAWIAPVAWLRIIAWPTVPGNRPYRSLYVIGFLHWLLMVQWVRLPHWTAAIGWLFLAAYLAVYLPLFIAIARVMVHRWHWPLLLAAPLVWTGLELIRARFLTGFPLLLLGHSQVTVLPIIQIADLFGAYGVSFVVMLIAACCERLVPMQGRQRVTVQPLLIASVVLCCTLAYGGYRLDSVTISSQTLKVALIQGSFDTQFDGDPSRNEQAYEDYVALTQRAAQENPDLDLVIWPESMFTANQPIVTYDQPLKPFPGWTDSLEMLQQNLDAIANYNRQKGRRLTTDVETPMIVGGMWSHLGEGKTSSYNSAIFMNEQGQIVDRYFKMHPVMFGEYLPLGNWIPWLYTLSPMGAGLTPGEAPAIFEVQGVRFAPNICFENFMPHLIRRQIKTLKAEGRDPDVMVTITNDGWFWGSSLLDIHLASGIFRAIEMRRPLLIAANTGFSAHVDPQGRVIEKGPRRAEEIVIANVAPSSLTSGYEWMGDVFAGICALLVIVAAVWGMVFRVKSTNHLA